MLLNDKIVLITGAAGTIGGATAKVCQDEGARLALVDVNGEALEKTASSLGLTDALLLTADVRDEAQVADFVKKTVDRYGRIDLFHNNAGTGGRRQTLDTLDLAAYRDWMELNLFGMVACLKHVLAQMYRQGGGAIVNTSSQVAHRPSVGGADYCVQKSAVLMLTRVAALEANGKGVRINAVLPGYVNSAMMRRNFEVFPQLEENIRKNVPLNRMCEPEEIGKAVAFLGSDYASYISGEALGVDGGHMANFM